MTREIITFLKSRHIDLSSSQNLEGSLSRNVLYVNPFNYMLLRTFSNFPDRLAYRVDGTYMRLVLRWNGISSALLPRQSFDFTSLAEPIFKLLSEKSVPLFICGGRSGEDLEFCEIIRSRFPGDNIVGSCHGYLEVDEIATLIAKSKAEYVLIGLGNMKQELLTLQLAKEANVGSMCCGAFISQTVKSTGDHYYPPFFRRFGGRWLYRFYREPHVIKRVVVYYPNILWLMLRDRGGIAFKR